MKTNDLQHRLNVLHAWRKWSSVNSGDELGDGATYRAVLDGCGITIRTLCYAVGIEANFRKFDNAGYAGKSAGRTKALVECCNAGRALIDALDAEEKRCFLEVIFFGNRAIAHATDGDAGHQVGSDEMTSAIRTIKKLLAATPNLQPELTQVRPEFLTP